MKNLIVVSGDYRGYCILGMGFDEVSKVLPIKYLVEDSGSRNEIITQLEPIIDDLFPAIDYIDNPVVLVSIDSGVLSSYLTKHLTARAGNKLFNHALLDSPIKGFDRVHYALAEGRIEAAEWMDQIDVALAAEADRDNKIEGHLMRALTYGVSRFIDSDYREPSIGWGMVRR
jgi:hypothetical protein